MFNRPTSVIQNQISKEKLNKEGVFLCLVLLQQVESMGFKVIWYK